MKEKILAIVVEISNVDRTMHEEDVMTFRAIFGRSGMITIGEIIVESDREWGLHALKTVDLEHRQLIVAEAERVAGIVTPIYGRKTLPTLEELFALESEITAIPGYAPRWNDSGRRPEALFDDARTFAIDSGIYARIGADDEYGGAAEALRQAIYLAETAMRYASMFSGRGRDIDRIW